MIRQRLRFRPGVALAYLLALGIAHILAELWSVSPIEQLSLSVIGCILVMSIYGKDWL